MTAMIASTSASNLRSWACWLTVSVTRSELWVVLSKHRLVVMPLEGLNPPPLAPTRTLRSVWGWSLRWRMLAAVAATPSAAATATSVAASSTAAATATACCTMALPTAGPSAAAPATTASFLACSFNAACESPVVSDSVQVTLLEDVVVVPVVLD